MTSVGVNERLFARTYPVPHTNPCYSRPPEIFVSLVDRYLQLVPYMAPTPTPTPTSLSHPDLHLDNNFVDPDTKEIAYIIDWQSAVVSEHYFQRIYPQMLTPVESHA